MLFNPMNEANSYCMLAVPLALFAWRWIEAGRPLIGWGFAGSLLLMGFASEIIRLLISKSAGNIFDIRFMPLVACAFIACLVRYRIPIRADAATHASARPTEAGQRS